MLRVRILVTADDSAGFEYDSADFRGGGALLIGCIAIGAPKLVTKIGFIAATSPRSNCRRRGARRVWKEKLMKAKKRRSLEFR